MIRRTTWILLAVFALLLGVTFYLKRNPIEGQSEDLLPTPAPLLISFDPLGETATLRLRDAEGREVVLQRRERDSWLVEGEPPRPADALTVMQGLNQLAALQVLSPVEADVPASALGLAPPQARLEFDLTDGRRVTLSVGALTPVGTGYYLQMDDAPPVVVEKYPVDGVLAWLDAPPYAPEPPPDAPPAP